MPKTKPTTEAIRQQVMNEWIFVCQARNGRPTNNKDFGKAVHISESTAARRKNDYRKTTLDELLRMYDSYRVPVDTMLQYFKALVLASKVSSSNAGNHY